MVRYFFKKLSIYFHHLWCDNTSIFLGCDFEKWNSLLTNAFDYNFEGYSSVFRKTGRLIVVDVL